MANDVTSTGPALSIPPVYASERPVLGGQTSVTLTAAATLASLGVSVAPLGAATLDASGETAVATFPITGGTEDGAQGGAVYLHVGSGLELSDAAGQVDLRNFRVDTQNGKVFSDVAIDGTRAGTLATFLIGAGGNLELTEQTAQVLDKALGTDALTDGLVVGTASVQPVDDPLSILFGEPGDCLAGPASGRWRQGTTGTRPIIGGTTEIDLTSAGTLSSLGVSVEASGFAALDTSAPTPAAFIPVTGGSQGAAAGQDRILHQGSGLTLSDTAGSVSLNDFFVDESKHRVFANVAVDGESVGQLAALRIGHDGATLLLTGKAATALNEALGTDALDARTIVGHVSTAVVATPTGFARDLERRDGLDPAAPAPHLHDVT